MAQRTASELRISAAQLREMAAEGSDVQLHAALLLVAEEFEREADRLDGIATKDGAVPS
jgi:hypothetical protein